MDFLWQQCGVLNGLFVFNCKALLDCLPKSKMKKYKKKTREMKIKITTLQTIFPFFFSFFFSCKIKGKRSQKPINLWLEIIFLNRFRQRVTKLALYFTFTCFTRTGFLFFHKNNNKIIKRMKWVLLLHWKTKKRELKSKVEIKVRDFKILHEEKEWKKEKPKEKKKRLL